MEDVLVSTVIPNYNGKSLLQRFLPSVLSCLKSGDELIIVDDNSTDDSVKYLVRNFKLSLTKKTVLPTKVSQNYYPQPGTFKHKLYTKKITVGKNTITMYLVALEKNKRFAVAANIGVLFASNDYVFLLNSDVKPTKYARNALLRHFSDKTVFGVGCLEYEKDSSGDKSGKNKLWFQKGMFMHSKADNMKTGPSAWVSGGSGMFDKQKWVDLNGFDKLFYPAYWEDVDLSFRARMKGWKVLFDETAVVFHVHESTNTDVFGEQKILDMSWNNSIKFVQKNATFLQRIQHYLFQPYWNFKRKQSLQQRKVAL
ncbi:glycosyltransferase [Candidatus Woesebacteria bacterium]|nr:glycosyltransferase [Candidatus Woesebacteria bacterium]